MSYPSETMNLHGNDHFSAHNTSWNYSYQNDRNGKQNYSRNAHKLPSFPTKKNYFDLTPIPLKKDKVKLPSKERQAELKKKLEKCCRHIQRLETSLNHRRTNKSTVSQLILAHKERRDELEAELNGHPLPEHFGQLYRARMPANLASTPSNTDAGIKELLDAKIQRVFLLCSDEECKRPFTGAGGNLREIYAKYGIKVVYFPIGDFGAWKQPEFNAKAHQLCNHLYQGENVAVHCMGGIGRTGTMVAAVASKILKISANDAIKYTRKHSNPSSVETSAQEKLVQNFAKKLGNRTII